jgi:hypothetical protein
MEVGFIKVLSTMAPHIGEELFANTLDTLEDISIYDQD